MGYVVKETLSKWKSTGVFLNSLQAVTVERYYYVYTVEEPIAPYFLHASSHSSLVTYDVCIYLKSIYRSVKHLLQISFGDFKSSTAKKFYSIPRLVMLATLFYRSLYKLVEQ